MPRVPWGKRGLASLSTARFQFAQLCVAASRPTTTPSSVSPMLGSRAKVGALRLQSALGFSRVSVGPEFSSPVDGSEGTTSCLDALRAHDLRSPKKLPLLGAGERLGQCLVRAAVVPVPTRHLEEPLDPRAADGACVLVGIGVLGGVVGGKRHVGPVGGRRVASAKAAFAVAPEPRWVAGECGPCGSPPP